MKINFEKSLQFLKIQALTAELLSLPTQYQKLCISGKNER